jgi:signal transduction histidine kinase
MLLCATGPIIAANTTAHQLFGSEHLSGVDFHSLVIDSADNVAQCLRLWSSSRQMLPAALRIKIGDKICVLRSDGALVEPSTTQSPGILLLHCVPRAEAAATTLFVRLNEQLGWLRKHVIEQRRRQQQALATMQTTAATFAHEISNPLNSISTSLQLLEVELLSKNVIDSPILSSIEAASREIQRLSSLVGKFRSFARGQMFKLRRWDLVQLIRDAVAPEMAAFATAGVAVELELSALPPVMVDPDTIRQAILNLCKNALEAMPNGGRLTLRAYAADGVVVVEVIDTGIGTPAGVNIFELFRTTKPNGSGIGLPVVAHIVSAHKGKVEYASEPGEGTVFKVSLPAAA